MQRIIFALIICLLFTALVAEEEIVSRRTFFSKTYHIDNNSFRTRLYSEPIHYQNESGLFIELDANSADYDSLRALAFTQVSVLRVSPVSNKSIKQTIYQNGAESFVWFNAPLYGMSPHDPNAGEAQINFRQVSEFQPDIEDIEIENTILVMDYVTVNVIPAYDMVEGCVTYQFVELNEGSIEDFTPEVAWDMLLNPDNNQYGEYGFLMELGLNSPFMQSYDCDYDDLDFGEDFHYAMLTNLHINISCINDGVSCVNSVQPNAAIVYVDLFYEYWVTVSGQVINMPPDDIPEIHICSQYDGITYIIDPDEDGNYNYLVAYQQDLTIQAVDTSESNIYAYLENYDFSWDEVDAHISNCNFTTQDPVTISGQVTNYSSIPIAGMDMVLSSSNDELFWFGEIESSGNYELLTRYGTSGTLSFEDNEIMIFNPPSYPINSISQDVTGYDFDSYEESQISTISGNVSMYNGTGDVQDVEVIIQKNSSPFDIINPDVDGDYSFNITPPDYGDYIISYELMPGTWTDDDYYTHQRELTINNGSDHLIDITMTRIDRELIIVSQDPTTSSFPNLNEACIYVNGFMNSTIYNGEMIRVCISSGTYYTPDFYTIELMYTDLNSAAADVKIIGVADVTFTHYPDALYDDPYIIDYSLINVNLEVSNINFVEYTTAANIEDIYYSSLCFDGCSFEDSGRLWDGVSTYINFSSGGAIKMESHYGDGDMSLKVIDCEFTNNVVSRGYNETASLTNTPLDNGFGGAVCVDLRNNTYSSVEVIIEDCIFEDNAANYGGAVFLHGIDNVEMTNNYFIGNTFSANSFTDPTTYPKKGAAIVALGSELALKKNLFNDQDKFYYQSTGYGQYVNWFDDCGDIYSTNNSYVYNHRLDPLYIIDSDNAYLTNDLYHRGTSLVDFSAKIENTLYDISYCLSYGSYGDDFVNGNGNSLTTSECYFTDPLLDANTFQPLWNATTLSPCIDNGNPDTDGDNDVWYFDNDERDIDGSSADIGAIAAEEHKNSVIKLNRDYVYNWISIPAIDNFTGSARINDQVDYVFDDYKDNGLFNTDPNSYILEHLLWLYNDENGIIEWYNNAFTLYPANVMSLDVRSQKGYKIQMSGLANPLDYLEYTGFKPGTSGNPGTNLHIEEPDVNSEGCEWNDVIDDYQREIWLGYYLEQSLSPEDALSPVWDDLIMVQARDWAMVRLPVAITNDDYTDLWLSCGDPAINCGEMVAVRYIGYADADFDWAGNNPNPPYVEYYQRELAEYFSYTQQPDYVPIFVDVNLDAYGDGDKPIEVAVLVDNVCKGAAVIKESQVQLNAYILNDSCTVLNNLEFELWFPQGSRSMQVEQYAFRDKETGTYVTRKATIEDCGDFLQVSLRDEDIETGYLPQVTCLKGNTPNPFNPETTINFELAKDSNVKLDIYNIKGQHICNLINEDLPAERHQAIWKGKNDQGKTVSSGVYFYVLQADGISQSKKMLLLK